MKVELDAELVYNVLIEAYEIMDKDEFACKVDEVYAECANLIAFNMNTDRKSTRLNSSHSAKSRMPSSA